MESDEENAFVRRAEEKRRQRSNRRSVTGAALVVVCVGLIGGVPGCAASEATVSDAAAPSNSAAPSAADTVLTMETLAALADTLPPAEAARYAFRGNDLKGKDGPMAKVGYDLAHLYFLDRARQHASEGGAFEPPPGVRVSDGRVLIDATAMDDGERLAEDLRRLGLEGGSVAGPVVSGRLPVEALYAASQLASLRSLRPSRPAAPTPLRGPAAPAQAPETVRATAAVEGCTRQAGGFTCSLRVREVHGRGASTPPVAQGSRQAVRFASGVIQSAGLSEDALQEGEVFGVTLQVRQSSSGEGEDVPWDGTRIESQPAGE